MNLFNNLLVLPLLMEVVHDMAMESLRCDDVVRCDCEYCPKPKVTSKKRWSGEEEGVNEKSSQDVQGCPKTNFDREPDGVDIHVDRPRIENYYSRHAWAKDMAEYRMLIDQAKKCDWPCREPMQGVPNYVYNNQRDWYEERGL